MSVFPGYKSRKKADGLVRLVPGNTEQGFILVLVLVLIAFMSFAMGTFSVWINHEIKQSKALQKRTETTLTAFNLKQNFLYLLTKGDKSPRGLDFASQSGKIPDGEEEGSKLSHLRLDDHTYTSDKLTVQLQDEGGLINLQNLGPSMKQLLSAFEVEESEVEGMIAKFKDYTSPNPTGTAKSLGGASADDYKEENLPPPTFKPLRTPFEIRRVLGWRDHEPFFKDDVLAKMTRTTAGKINLNTAPPAVLSLLKEITPEIKEFLLEKRKTDKPYIKQPTDIKNATGQDFKSSINLGVFPSGSIRATISSKEIVFNKQISVSQTLYDEKIPWRINYEIELEGTQPMVESQVEDTEDSETQRSLFPDPALLFTQDKGSDSA